VEFEGKRKGLRGSDPQKSSSPEREREARLRKEMKGHRSLQLLAK